MLGTFLHNAASALRPSSQSSSTNSKSNSAQSIAQEDIYTRSLLFPDAVDLQQPLSSHSLRSGEWPAASTGPTNKQQNFDNRGGFDLQCPRDIRIIIAQDAIGSAPKTVLFDSNAQPSDPKASRNSVEDTTAATSFNRSSTDVAAKQSSSQKVQKPGAKSAGQSPVSPQKKTFSSNATVRSPIIGSGVFERSKSRTVEASLEAQKSARPPSESPTDIKLLLDCVFGTAPLSYRGDSTRVHVFPETDRPQTRAGPISSSFEGQGSFGRVEGRRRSQLAQSYTPGDFMPKAGSAWGSQADGRKTVLLTRTFAVSPSEVSPAKDDDLPVGSASSLPFPQFDDAPRSRRMKQQRTPMFAVAVVLRMPPQSVESLQRAQNSWTDSSTSRNADTDSGWTFLRPKYGRNALLPEPFASDIDDRIEIVMQHWEIVTRTLLSIQHAVKKPISQSLRGTGVNDSEGIPKGAQHVKRGSFASSSRQAGPMGNDFKESKHPLCLNAGALSENVKVQKCTALEASRLVDGIQIPKIITGQSRWEIWRAEAQQLMSWSNGHGEPQFFQNLLATFLENHTSCLNTMSQQSAKHIFSPQMPRSNDDLSMSRRTVIMSQDRFVARRLIFLLALFLPPSHKPSGLRSLSQRRNDTEDAANCWFNRGSDRDFLRQSLSRRSTQPTGDHRRRCSISFSEESSDRSSSRRGSQAKNATGHNANLSLDLQHAKTWGLPIPRSGNATRKTSAATTSTVTPGETVPQFVAANTDAYAQRDIQDRRESLASLNLKHNLRRHQTSDQSVTSSESQPASRWGSLVSGFWSVRRGSSADQSSSTVPPEEVSKPDSKVPLPSSNPQPPRGGLSQMVQEAKATSSLGKSPQPEHRDANESISSQNTKRDNELDLLIGQDMTGTDAFLEPQFKLSVDEHDGVVDVELPLSSLMSSPSPFGSPIFGAGPGIASESQRGARSMNSFDSGTSGESLAQNSTAKSHDFASSPNVAGWLKAYHPDFALQAVLPYAQLQSDIRESMRRELRSMTGVIPAQWTDSCTTLIVSVHPLAIRRVRLQRRAYPEIERGGAVNGQKSTDSQYRFIEEPISSLGNDVLEALDHLVADLSGSPIFMEKDAGEDLVAGGQSSNTQSILSSHSTSKVVDE